jgi:hypothetical protein
MNERPANSRLEPSGAIFEIHFALASREIVFATSSIRGTSKVAPQAMFSGKTVAAPFQETP